MANIRGENITFRIKGQAGPYCNIQPIEDFDFIMSFQINSNCFFSSLLVSRGCIIKSQHSNQ